MAAMQTHFIFYVSDQARSAKFYSKVLGLEPTLNVPGMTEFSLSDGTIFGLMPETGILRLLGPDLPDPAKARTAPRAELYLRVKDAAPYHARAVSAGAKELSPLLPRDWGDAAAYSLDLDGHVLAFAEKPPIA